MAPIVNAIAIVCSRPILSDTQPKNGRPNPSKMRSSEIANVSAAIWKPTRLTGTLAILKSCAIGRDLRRRHQAARRNHDKGHVHDPEDRRADHLRRRVVDLGLRHAHLALGGRNGKGGLVDEESQRQNDDPLPDAKA